MSCRGGWRPHIESALRLNLPRLFAQSALLPGRETWGSWQWTNDDGDRVASVGYCAVLGGDSGTLTLDYTHADRDTGERKAVTCVIRLYTVRPNYGGLRWYFVCPYTGRRALKLYKWAGIEQFCHRTAIRPTPTYASQRDGGSDRIMRQRWAIRRKLGDEYSDLFGEPFKPKWMRWHTFQRYLDRDAELGEREGVYLARLLGRFTKLGMESEARLLGIDKA